MFTSVKDLNKFCAVAFGQKCTPSSAVLFVDTSRKEVTVIRNVRGMMVVSETEFLEIERFSKEHSIETIMIVRTVCEGQAPDHFIIAPAGLSGAWALSRSWENDGEFCQIGVMPFETLGRTYFC